MKKTVKLFTLCLLIVSASACNRHNDGNVSFAVSDSDDQYKIKAEYDEDKTRKLYRYITKSIHPNDLFGSEDNELDATVQLDDHTRFYVKSSPGKLLIKLDKRENSRETYEKFREMAKGMKEVLTD